MSNDSKLTPRSINDLLTEDFLIPSYQRGYRWKSTQVKQLLDDIWLFDSCLKNQPIDKKSFYCLQPVVVKKNSRGWEVIDGQQRLTTILIILHYCNQTEFKVPKKVFSLCYQTRDDSDTFLKNIEDDMLAERNVDYYHIHAAYHVVRAWFEGLEKENSAIRGDFYSKLVNCVQVIWYEVKEDCGEEDENSAAIDVFTRLNNGKISLTNAELIKALFLQRDNFREERATLKQVQIASEWDEIERTLQQDSFWYFIYNPDEGVKYENRIEYIFDLMKNKSKGQDKYYTFYQFSEEFLRNRTKEGRPDIDKLWLEVKRYFLTFQEWYNHPVFYHYVGYLVECGEKVRGLKEESEKQKTKDDFKSHLVTLIRKQVDCEIDELEYGNKRVKRVLLLFNIITILQTDKTDLKFPFYRYKREKWDIEHVRSQTDKDIAASSRKDWIKDILDYYLGLQISEESISTVEDEISKMNGDEGGDKEQKICRRLLKLWKSERVEEAEFNALYKDIIKELKEDKEIDGIGNLALLDAATNRSYKNAMFPIKRRTIIENDKKGVFIPICTKNLFLKMYSRKMEDLMCWKPADAEGYVAAIREILREYLPKQTQSND